MSHSEEDSVRRILAKIVREKSPISGAQLKVRLIWETTRAGLRQFDEGLFGYRKFTDFLADIGSDLLTIEYPEGPGDVKVSMRETLNGPESEYAKPKRETVRLRNDAWQAFTNPDPKRKRFWSKETGAIHHYLEGQGSDLKEQICSQPSLFIEIQPIKATKQRAWMKNFLDDAELTDQQKQTILPIPDQPYSSFVNVLFTRALGKNGESWRSFRIGKVLEQAREWAENNDIPFEQLKSDLGESPASAMAARAVIENSVRDRLDEVLSMLNDDDIRQVILPTALACILVRTNAINQ